MNITEFLSNPTIQSVNVIAYSVLMGSMAGLVGLTLVNAIGYTLGKLLNRLQRIGEERYKRKKEQGDAKWERYIQERRMKAEKKEEKKAKTYREMNEQILGSIKHINVNTSIPKDLRGLCARFIRDTTDNATIFDYSDNTQRLARKGDIVQITAHSDKRIVYRLPIGQGREQVVNIEDVEIV